MKLTIDMIGLHTKQLDRMRDFYVGILGTQIVFATDAYVEFAHDGVRFSISSVDVMHEHTGVDAYLEKKSGHAFELAFRVDTASDVDRVHDELSDQGVTIVQTPADMPWGQRTCFFSDPDGNIHEIFADLS